jgi:eukaryotic-like serine/threonine-protein kinase
VTWVRPKPGGTRQPRAGNSDVMSNLAVLHEQRGELAVAETWYRQAAQAGHSVAMNNLAVPISAAG